MADISKKDLQEKIAEILDGADLSKTSAKKVRERLEKDLGTKLLSRKKEIDALVMEYVNSQNSKNGGDAGSDEDDDEEEDDNDSDEPKGTKRPSSSKKPAAKKAKKDDSDDASEGSEDEEDSDEGFKKKSKPPKARKLPPKKKRGSDSDSDDEWKKKKGKKGGGGGKRQGSGYTKSLKLSPELAALVGQESMARHEVVKKVWAIIKERNLYDPKNKQFAICDDAMLKVFGTKRFQAFGMMKYLKNHFVG